MNLKVIHGGENVGCKNCTCKREKTQHCCDLMNSFLEDLKVPIKYYPITREYMLLSRYSYAVQPLAYCPWCSKKLPEPLGKVYAELMQAQEGYVPRLDPHHQPIAPEEFTSDEWWKKRGL